MNKIRILFRRRTGKLATSAEEVVDSWNKDFDKLLNIRPNHATEKLTYLTAEALGEAPTIEEV